MPKAIDRRRLSTARVDQQRLLILFRGQGVNRLADLTPYLEWAPGVGQDQSADLTIGRVWQPILGSEIRLRPRVNVQSIVTRDDISCLAKQSTGQKLYRRAKHLRRGSSLDLAVALVRRIYMPSGHHRADQQARDPFQRIA